MPNKDLEKQRRWIIMRDNLFKQKVSGIKFLETFSRWTSYAKAKSIRNIGRINDY